jgi:hypothetical protein
LTHSNRRTDAKLIKKEKKSSPGLKAVAPLDSEVDNDEEDAPAEPPASKVRPESWNLLLHRGCGTDAFHPFSPSARFASFSKQFARRHAPSLGGPRSDILPFMQTESNPLNDCKVSALAINALSRVADAINGVAEANLKVSDNKSRRLAAKRKREDERDEDGPKRAASPELCKFVR